ncbi:MAG: hypothetical protein E6X17_03835 [Sporomusaceae bacterium]|nr:hypothetical protein [Sporomusaceae bacterium]
MNGNKQNQTGVNIMEHYLGDIGILLAAALIIVYMLWDRFIQRL